MLFVPTLNKRGDACGGQKSVARQGFLKKESALAARAGAGRRFVFCRFHSLETFFDKLDDQVGDVFFAGRFYALQAGRGIDFHDHRAVIGAQHVDAANI